MPTPTLAQLHQAVAIAEQIEKLQTELASLMVGGSSVAVAGAAIAQRSPSPIKIRGKRTMSPETIAKMKASQQARWAKKKGATPSKEPAKTKAPKAEKKKRVLSAEGRARIVAALKARHAAVAAKKAAQVKAAPTVKKKAKK